MKDKFLVRILPNKNTELKMICREMGVSRNSLLTTLICKFIEENKNKLIKL